MLFVKPPIHSTIRASSIPTFREFTPFYPLLAINQQLIEIISFFVSPGYAFLKKMLLNFHRLLYIIGCCGKKLTFFLTDDQFLRFSMNSLTCLTIDWPRLISPDGQAGTGKLEKILYGNVDLNSAGGILGGKVHWVAKRSVIE